MNNEETAQAEAFTRLCKAIARLRAPDGCPWDLEQSPASLRGDLIEETYECIEAIDEKDPAHIGVELGVLFLLVTMLSYMHQQEGSFSVADVLNAVSDKIIRRHPHVFGEVKVKDSAEVLTNWARIKVEQEGRKPKDSLLDEVSRGLGSAGGARHGFPREEYRNFNHQGARRKSKTGKNGLFLSFVRREPKVRFRLGEFKEILTIKN
jgi:tetrapyrrole methylase family protein/MazG family protein